MERPCQAPPGLTVFCFGPAFRPTGGTPAFVFDAGRRVFPPEPPVAMMVSPEPRGDVMGAPGFGAAKRTLDGEHGSGMDENFDGRLGGNTFLLVSSELR